MLIILLLFANLVNCESPTSSEVDLFVPSRPLPLRGKLSNIFSVSLNGGMPQGSWLGPLTFIVLLDDLSMCCLMHKFVDDTTLSEIICKYAVIQINDFLVMS